MADVRHSDLTSVLKDVHEVYLDCSASHKDKEDEIVFLIMKCIQDCVQKKQLQERIEKLQLTKKGLDEKLNGLQNIAQGMKDEKGKLESIIEVRLKMLGLFRKHLGLKMKRIDEDNMKIGATIMCQFTNIDKQNPQDAAVFKLSLTDNVYSVSCCEPHVEGIEELVSELNKTNDISAFMINMRKKICSFV